MTCDTYREKRYEYSSGENTSFNMNYGIHCNGSKLTAQGNEV
jgi:hypothetical protein